MFDWAGYLGVGFLGFCMGLIVMAGASARSYERGRTEGAARTRRAWGDLHGRAQRSWAREAARLAEARDVTEGKLREAQAALESERSAASTTAKLLCEEQDANLALVGLVGELTLAREVPNWAARPAPAEMDGAARGTITALREGLASIGVRP